MAVDVVLICYSPLLPAKTPGKKRATHLGDGQLASFLDPVYPDTLFSEQDNRRALLLHDKQGLNPIIVKHLFKGAAADDRRCVEFMEPSDGFF